jgi:hypothetical protein
MVLERVGCRTAATEPEVLDSMSIHNGLVGAAPKAKISALFMVEGRRTFWVCAFVEHNRTSSDEPQPPSLVQ